MENYKIYGLKLKDSNDIRYIGLTKQSLHNRLIGHKSTTSKRNTKNGNWINKHKDNIEIILIEESLVNLQDANEREIYWINYYKELGNDLTNGTLGGDGVNPTEESRNKMSESAKGRKHSYETKKLISEILRNREPISDETRNKMSESAKGREHTYETKEKLRIINIGKKMTDNEKLIRREKMVVIEPPNKGVSMSEEQKSKLSNTLKGKPTHKSKPIDVFNKLGELIGKYESPIECSIEMSLNRRCIYEVLNKRRKTYKGFIFKYRTL
jgi:hypothetical protein